jgi:hypothetical protein
MNLELVPRDELLDELSKRYETVVVALHSPRGDGTSNRMLWFAGQPFIALGLTVELQQEIHKKVEEGSEIDGEQTDPKER